VLKPGARLGPYEIVAPIGAGGMGEVYRARDTRLERDVALKVLPADALADETAQARLLREARTASKLNHPNVCTIHEVGEADGQVYIAMELVEGQSLAARLAEGALLPEELLRYGQQVADALSHAHEHGVVHRDFKSANIVITPEGRAKVLDFGLAKRFAGEDLTAATTVSQPSLTEPGAVAGTLAYMAPEQLRGRPADARSDIWALGVVLYEMAGGRRPFQGMTGFELSSAILSEAPPPLSPTVPVPVAAVIERCLAKEPGQRYQRASEVRVVLEAIRAGTVVPWVTWRYRVAHRPWQTLGLALVLTVAVAVGLDLGGMRGRLLGRGTAAAAFQSLAVLPLENLSGNPEQEYLAAGMHDALVTNLGQLAGLKRVIARGSVMRYKGTSKSPREIARELNVSGLITGTVLRSGDRVRITAQLIDPATQAQVWAQSYERELRDVLSLENDIVAAITHEIKLELTPQEKVRLTSARPVDPEAYEACLKGRFHWYKLSREELDTAERYFNLALDKDPNYALAHEGLAMVWFSRTDAGFMPRDEAMPRANAEARRALELDDTLAEAHAMLANLKIMDWEWAAADREFRRSLELNPNLVIAHFGYADFLVTMGRTAEWEKEIRRMLELDPLSNFNRCFYGWHLVYERRYDEAIDQMRKVAQAEPDLSSVHLGLWGAYFKKGADDKALAEAKRFFSILGDSEVVKALDAGWVQGGYRPAMKRAGDALSARYERTYYPAIRVARVLAHAGENERALQFLEKAYERRETPLYHIGVGWDWDALRPDPRFQSLLRRMNLPSK